MSKTGILAWKIRVYEELTDSDGQSHSIEKKKEKKEPKNVNNRKQKSYSVKNYCPLDNSNTFYIKLKTQKNRKNFFENYCKKNLELAVKHLHCVL